MEHTERILKFFIAVSTMEKQISRLRSMYMHEVGLNGAEMSVLIVLYSHPDGLRLDELVKATRTDKSQISRSQARLGRLGWIEKEDGVAYKARYRLSAKGCVLMEELAKKAEEVFDTMHTRMDEKQFEDFYVFAHHISNAIEELMVSKKEQDAKEEREDISA